MYTELKDRKLYFDGCLEVSEDKVSQLLLAGIDPKMIISSGDDIEKFNSLVDNIDEMISCEKTELLKLDKSWKIPEYYFNLDLEEYFIDLVKSYDQRYVDRVLQEIQLVKHHKMQSLIKTLIYVVDKFRANNVVWGVGRGSSCASILLYLIDLHCVDPIKWDIQAEEFFHN